MDLKCLALQLIAVSFAVFMLNLPLTSAATVDIFSKGELKDSVDLSPGNIVNRQISVVHEAKDITWSNVKVLASINSATLAYSIKKIYIFKCQNLDPVECVRGSPIIFDSYVDTEIAWKDMSKPESSAAYPQVGRLLTLVKLEDSNRKSFWIGFWD